MNSGQMLQKAKTHAILRESCDTTKADRDNGKSLGAVTQTPNFGHFQVHPTIFQFIWVSLFQPERQKPKLKDEYKNLAERFQSGKCSVTPREI